MRTHFNTLSSRDASNSASGQGATTRAYPLRYGKEERRGIRRSIAASQRVLAIFSPRFVAPRHGRIKLPFPRRVLRKKKIAQERDLELVLNWVLALCEHLGIMTQFEERLKKLNDRQKQAVDTIEGPVMVIAGPGSGKTELLSLRVANILRATDTAPGNILCLTFTDAAAFNMRQRLAGLLGREAYRVAIHTFHSFGVEVINRYPEYFYNGALFTSADTITQIEILEDIFNKLAYNNPLRSQHNDQFVYLNPVKKAIEHIKKAGLSPAEFKTIVAENKNAAAHTDLIIQSIFNDRISKKMFVPARAAARTISEYTSTPLPGSFTPFAAALANSLTEALDEAEEQNATSPLTIWKDNWTRKHDDGLRHLADMLDAEKFAALADMYETYIERMHAEGYYDYDDMILDTIAMLENNLGVRLDLQERYQYILVDEFQDTNDAQMRLLRLLTDNAVHEGRPNILVVGDNDQAIYKFQGAEISNILDFRKTYREPSLVVLKHNYRSTQAILDVARHVIKKGAARLENISTEMQKELIAANAELKKGAISHKEFPSRDTQYHWLAQEVKKVLGKGIPAKEIAIIARWHSDLEALVPYFHAAQVPVAYERQQNVLREPHILQLISMARYVDSVIKKNADADELLPEILSFPFWNIPRKTVWELSVTADKERTSWLAVMHRSGGQLAAIADFFTELGARATYQTAEEILHELLGGPQQIMPDENSDEEAPVRHTMFSPFRSYYFGKDRREKYRPEYLQFLSSLQSFVGALREYHRGCLVTVRDILTFVDMHEKNNLTINNTSPFVNDMNAVQLMTAHKAKGLEFETVFVINCQEDVWADSGRDRNLSLPSNVPISPSRDTLDDQLRLFYVALTRAKSTLYLTSYHLDQRGKESSKLGFLTPSEGAPQLLSSEFIAVEDMNITPEDLLITQWNTRHAGPFIPNEKALLTPLLETYQLSVTHLQNFLNVINGGPLTFFEKNLLQFPEPKNANSAYGTAMHAIIARMYSHLKSKGDPPTTETMLAWFKESLAYQQINKRDFELMLARGQKALKTFYEQKKNTFSTSDIIEFDFKNQGVLVGDARLTGKIDKIIVSDSEITVSDLKTGRPIKNWSPSDAHEKVNAWKYTHQLIFYKLLIEHSREFGGKYTMKKGIVEFMEPLNEQIINLSMTIEEERVERTRALINVVYKKIIALDFPDISRYSKDVNGIIAFEDDLLREAGAIRKA